MFRKRTLSAWGCRKRFIRTYWMVSICDSKHNQRNDGMKISSAVSIVAATCLAAVVSLASAQSTSRRPSPQGTEGKEQCAFSDEIEQVACANACNAKAGVWIVESVSFSGAGLGSCTTADKPSK